MRYELIYEDMLLEAEDLLHANKISDAVAIVETIIARCPDFGKAYNLLGYIYETKIKDLQKAETLYKQCIAFSPDFKATYLNLSIVLSTLGKHEEQKKLLEEALKVPGIDRSSIYNEMGIMEELELNFNAAIEQFKQAIRFSLSDANIELYRASMERCRKKRELLAE